MGIIEEIKMATKKQKSAMMDYLASRLEGFGSPVISIKGTVNTIVLPGTGIVMVVDGQLPNDGLKRAYVELRTALEVPDMRDNIAMVLYKDGKTFFRNAAHGTEAGLKGVRYKSTLDLSLKNYDQDEVNRMIALRPEEKFIADFRNTVQYYQPESAGLDQGLVSFRFEPVTFDYSHIPANERYGPIQEESKRTYIWTRRSFSAGPLMLARNFLVERPKQTQKQDAKPVETA